MNPQEERIYQYNQKAIELARSMGLDEAETISALGIMFSVAVMTMCKEEPASELQATAHEILDGVLAQIIGNTQPHG